MTDAGQVAACCGVMTRLSRPRKEHDGLTSRALAVDEDEDDHDHDEGRTMLMRVGPLTRTYMTTTDR
ncbi:hypothetical protein VTH06DRAFT_6662 [Thermothelomyces fergusii]